MHKGLAVKAFSEKCISDKYCCESGSHEHTDIQVPIGQLFR